MTRPTALQHLALVGLALGPALIACTGAERERPPYYEESESGPTGSLGLSLTLSNGAIIESVTADLASPALASEITRTIPVAPAGATASAQFGGLPEGDYTVSLSAVSADGDTTCSGSADFTIIIDETVGVLVPMTCKSASMAGEVIIDVGLNVCPTLEFLFVAPLKVAVGSNISVEAAVVDPDGDDVSYAWTASSGSFIDSSAPATSYVCSTPGLKTITLTTNDGGDCEQITHLQVGCILTSFTSCEPGEYQTAAPTQYSDRECATCAPGSYSTIENAAACLPWTTCVAGEFVEVPGSTTIDQSCNDCPAGTFSTDDDAPSCAAWSPCAWGEVQVASGTATTDTQCGPGGEPFRQFGTSAADGINALWTDAEGSVYAAGVTQGSLEGSSAGSFDAFVRKYDWTGNVEWTRQFGTSGLEYATGVAVAGDGNVYVAGYTTGSLDGTSSGLTDAYLRKYDTNGALLWARQFGTTNHDYGYGVAVGPTGDVIVAGMTQGSLDGANFGGPDGYLRKYSPSGSVVWTRQYGTDMFEYPAGVAIDALGNAYVAGGTSGNLAGSSAGSQDGYVRKYSAAGLVAWTSQFGSSGMETVKGPAVDASGHVYVVGGTTGSLSGAGAGSTDAFLRALDGAGAHLFTRQFGTSTFDTANGVAVRGSGDVYIAGITGGALDGTATGGTDAFVRHYSNTGSLVWSDQFGTTSSDTAIAAALDGSPNVFAGGYTDGTLGGVSAGGTDAYVVKLPEP